MSETGGIVRRLRIVPPVSAPSRALTDHVGRFAELFVERWEGLARVGGDPAALMFDLEAEDEDTLDALRRHLAESLFGADDHDAVTLEPVPETAAPRPADADARPGPAATFDPLDAAWEPARPQAERYAAGGPDLTGFAGEFDADPVDAFRDEMRLIARAMACEAAGESAARLRAALDAFAEEARGKLDEASRALQAETERLEAAARRIEAGASGGPALHALARAVERLALQTARRDAEAGAKPGRDPDPGERAA